jgi:hypothetical protein
VSFTPDIPDGTTVRFIGASNAIPHEWREGKITPREDKEATARLDAIVAGKRFETDADQASKWALVRGPAMFLGVVSVLMALQWLWGRNRAMKKISTGG